MQYQVIKKIDRFLFIKEIGKGFSGTVYIALDIEDKERKPVAIKEIKKKSTNMDEQRLRKFIQNEKTILYLCKSKGYQNIIQVIDSFVTQDSHYIVLEYCSQNLSCYVETLKSQQNSQYLNESSAINILIQINQAMISLHENFIYHRDLKPENILINQNEHDNIKISDFGFSRVLLEEDMLETGLGTQNYMAPEILKGEVYNPKLSDMFSLGIILFEILCGRPHQVNEELNFNLNPFLSEDMKDLIRQMTKQNPQERLKWEDLGNQNIVKRYNQFHTEELNYYYLKLWENKINVLNCCLSDIEQIKQNHQDLKSMLEVFENQLLTKTYNEIGKQIIRIENLDFEANIKQVKREKFRLNQEEVNNKISALANSNCSFENRDYITEKQRFESIIKRKEIQIEELKKKNQKNDESIKDIQNEVEELKKKNNQNNNEIIKVKEQKVEELKNIKKQNDDEFINQKRILDELKSLEYKIKFCDDFDNDFFNVFAEQKIKNHYQQKFDILLMQTQDGFGLLNNFFKSLQMNNINHTNQRLSNINNESQILVQQIQENS